MIIDMLLLLLFGRIITPLLMVVDEFVCVLLSWCEEVSVEKEVLFGFGVVGVGGLVVGLGTLIRGLRVVLGVVMGLEVIIVEIGVD
jgi:hypothetical protein